MTVADSAGAQVFTAQGQGISTGLGLSPTFAIFGAQMVNTASPAQTIALRNTGTIALTLNPIAVSSNFLESDQCPVILQPNAVCSISVEFAPNSTGAIYGSLVASDTSGQAETLLALSGQGTLPGISAIPSTLSFGSLSVGTPSDAQTVTVWNTGSAPLLIGAVSGTGDFTETDNCASQTLPVNGYCVINVVMTPSTMGTRTGAIQFYNNADGQHTIALSGMGQQAGVSITPTHLAFGSLPATTPQLAAQTIGTSLSVTVTNTGNLPLELGGFATQGDFTESDNCGSNIPVGSACALTVTFVPTAVGHRTGTLTITDNAGGGTQTVSLEGDGSPSGLLLTPPVLNFGIETIGLTSAPLEATLTNDTGQTLNGLAITASGEYSETDNCGGTLAKGANCTLNITITPATTGAITGTINISAGASVATGTTPGSTSTGIGGFNLGVIALTASSIKPGIELTIPSLSFSVTSAGSSGPSQAVTLINTGSSTALTHLTISETNGSEFPFSTTCPQTLAAHTSCTITVNFTPTSVGLRAGIMHIAADGGISAALTESGTVNQIAPGVAVLSSGAETMLQNSATFTATVSSPLGTPTGTVAFMDGASLLGTSNLSAGTAAFTTSSLATGPHSITAVYSGDAYFVAITSGAVSESIVDFALSANSASNGGGTKQPVVPGSSAAFTVSIAPTTGTALPAQAVLSVNGLPAGATATLNAAAWVRLSATSWQLPANTQLSDIALSFAIPSETAKTNAPASPHRNVPPVLWGILLLPFAVSLRRARKRMAWLSRLSRISRMSSLLVILIAGAAAIAGLSGCNSGNGFFAQSPQSYDLTITVTTGALEHSTGISLIVE